MDLIKYDMTDIWAVAGDVVAPDSAKVRAGWGVEVVPRQWWNWFENRQDNNLAYMLQKGIPEWDATTEYIINKSYVQRNGIVYKATATSTNSDPIALTSWVRAFADYSVASNALGGLTPAADRLPYFNGTSTAALTNLTSFARTILDDADDVSVRTTISAQQSNVNLSALSTVSAAANLLPYFNGTTTMTGTTLTAYGRSLIAVADAATGRTTLGLGNSATLNVGTATGTVAAGDDSRIVNALQKGNNLSDVTNAATARTNISAQTLNSNLTALSGITGAADLLPYFTGVGTMTTTTMSSYARSVLSATTAAAARSTLVAAMSGANTDITSLSGVTLGGTTVLGGFTESLITIASAATTDIGSAAGNVITVTGTTSITALGTAPAGTRKQVRFAGVLTLTHNSSALSLPTQANITTAVDDVAEFRSLGSGNWFCTEYNRSNGQPLAVVSVVQGGTGVTTSTGTGSNVLSASPTFTGAPTVPTQAVGDNSTNIASTAYVANQIANYSSNLINGTKNRVINGDCRIAQRGSGVYTSGVFGYAGPDRFFGNNSSAGGQFTQSQGTLVDGVVTKNCITQTVNTVIADTSGTKFWSGIIQYIEGFNCYDLVGQAVTVSFLFKSSVAGTYSVALRDSTSTYSYISTFTVSANTVTKITVNVPAIPSSASVPNSSAVGLQLQIGALNAVTYATSTLNTWQNANYICATTLTNWGLTSGATISVADLQLESGSSATTFERRNYTQELLLCQRYYTTYNVTLRFYAAITGQTLAVPVTFPASMRVTPTSTLLTTGSYANLQAGYVFATETKQMAYFLMSAGSGGSDCTVIDFNYSLNSEL